jgi:hypothetical protein
MFAPTAPQRRKESESGADCVASYGSVFYDLAPYSPSKLSSRDAGSMKAFESARTERVERAFLSELTVHVGQPWFHSAVSLNPPKTKNVELEAFSCQMISSTNTKQEADVFHLI